MVDLHFTVEGVEMLNFARFCRLWESNHVELLMVKRKGATTFRTGEARVWTRSHSLPI